MFIVIVQHFSLQKFSVYGCDVPLQCNACREGGSTPHHAEELRKTGTFFFPFVNQLVQEAN